MAIAQTSNSHSTHLLVAEQIPDFIRDDHPVFVEFVEKYYEFLNQANSAILTSDGDSYYYGAGYATQIIPDIADIDTTDLDLFVNSFKKQYGVGLPNQVLNTDRKLLYKNLVNFYRAKGTEDSFKFLFRVLYNEEISLYYPKHDMLIASGGDYNLEATIQVPYSKDLKNIVGRNITGDASGATAVVERMTILQSDPALAFKSGSWGNNSTSTPKVRRATLDGVYDADTLRHLQSQKVLLNLNAKTVSGKFNIHETVYTNDNEAGVNTVILPILSKRLLQEDFNYAITDLISVDSGRADRTLSNNVPWGYASITSNSLHGWFSSYSDGVTDNHTGNLVFISDGAGSVSDGNVLQIGNTGFETGGGEAGDARRNLYYNSNFAFDDTKLYKVSARVRALPGNASFQTAGSSRLSAGIAVYDEQNKHFTTGYDYGQYKNDMFILAHDVAIDDQWFVYDGWFKGRQEKSDYDTGNHPYSTANYGDGGRVDLEPDRATPSVSDALNGNSILPYNTAHFSPVINVNKRSDSASDIYDTDGVTQIDYVYVDEYDSMLTRQGSYVDESSHLSSTSGYLQDQWYYQIYAYEIKSGTNLNEYKKIIKETAHPAGLEMFGTKISESSANAALESSDNNLINTFSPDSINALAGWWRADAIGPDNVEWKKFTPDATNASNGIFGTNTNRMTAGGSLFEDKDADYLSRINSRDTGGAGDSIHVDYTNISAPPVGGSRSLKITDGHVEETPEILLGPTSALGGYRYNRDYDDQSFGIVLDPGKTWLVSCYAMTSNLISDVSGMNSFSFNFHSSNTSGYSGSNKSSANVEPFTAVNTWERKANTIDMSSGGHINTTRTFLKFIFPDRRSFTQATGNTYYLIDGIMVEEYDSAIHGATAPFTPSPYVRPGMNGANVVSWYDQSVNEHHVYANTHGGKFYKPQFIANAVNGMPAVRFSANTVKNSGNVYAYSSIGGTIGSASGTKPPTTALQADTMLASNALAKPVSNSWTIMAVAKTNLFYNSDQYGDTTFAGQEPKATIFNSGYNGSPYHIEDDSPTPGGSGGSMDLFLDRTGSGTRGKLQTHTSNGSMIRNVEGPTLTTNPNTFSIFGISEFAGTGSSANVHFYYNGLRSEIAGWSADTANANFENDGIVWDDQQPYVTSIGGWAPSNNKIWDTGTDGVNQRYPYGEHAWDGDIAEIVVFNEKLSNTNIALVEGYLAHKYGLQDSLVHKNSGSVSNTISHHWNFTNSQDGWEPNLLGGGSLTTNANDLQYSGGSVNHYMDTDISENPINGSAFTKMKIRMSNAGTVDHWTGKLYWTVIGGNQDLSSGYNVVAISSAPGSSLTDRYVDLSGQANWTQNMISKLRLEFTDDTDSEIYNIDEITVHDDTRTQHPFRYVAPPAVGFSNTWFKDY